MLLMLAQINYSYHCMTPSQTSKKHITQIVTCCRVSFQQHFLTINTTHPFRGVDLYIL